MILTVIDTNILISALLRASGYESMLIQAIDVRLVAPCFSSAILHEYRTVLGRRKFSFSAAAIESLIMLMTARGTVIEVSEHPIQSPDPSDTMFISCALAARADAIVTGNRKHFPAGHYGTADVVNARELLDRITLPH